MARVGRYRNGVPGCASVIPTIDLAHFADGGSSTAARAEAHRIDDALRDVGFLLVSGHGVRPETRAAYFGAMHDFFALPQADKDAIAIGNSVVHRGYVGFGAESLDEVAGDLKESLDTGVDHGADHPEVIAHTPLHGPNQLPDLPGFRDAWAAYFAEVVEVARRMQRGLAMALGLPPGYFEALPGEVMYHLRLLHYPPMERVTPEPGQLGCGAHTDYGSLTVLADDGVGGLQVRQRSGEWTDVTIPDGLLVINLGDLMAIWTDDRWVSNPHRVVNPAGVDRYSSPLFVTPPFHLEIETIPTCLEPGASPRHEPMVSGPYLLSRFDGTHSYR